MRHETGSLAHLRGRPAAIARIFDEIVTPRALSFLRDDLHLPMTIGRAWLHREEKVFAPGSRLTKLSARLMTAYRDAGYLSPCPNNGPRAVCAMTAWNAWVEGGAAWEAVSWQSYLSNAGGFWVLEEAFIETCRRQEMAWADTRGSTHIDSTPLTEDLLDREIVGTIALAREIFINETLEQVPNHQRYYSSLEKGGMKPGGTVFRPVLRKYDEERKAWVELPPVDAEASPRAGLAV